MCGDEADLPLAHQHAGAARPDSPVARERQSEARAGDDTVDRGDDRFLEPLDGVDQVGQAMRDVAVGARVVQLVEAPNVAAGTEVPAGTGQDHAHDRRVERRLVQRGAQGVPQLGVDRVSPSRAVERKREDAARQGAAKRSTRRSA